jgi:hypothetical protein
VHDTTRVGRGYAGYDRQKNRSRLFYRQHATAIQPSSESLAEKKIHYDGRTVCVVPNIVHSHDIRVTNRKERLRFSLESSHRLCVRSHLGPQAFDGHASIGSKVARGPNDT